MFLLIESLTYKFYIEIDFVNYSFILIRSFKMFSSIV